MANSKIRKSNLHTEVTTMISTMIGENALDSANFNSILASKTTDDIAEGSNLYYTTTRGDSDFDTRLATKTTDNLSEGSNQYFTNARADARADVRIAAASITDLSDADQAVGTTDDVTFNNLVLTGTIDGPSTMYIDPAPVDSDGGLLVIRGNLQVDGTTTTINSTTVSINDKNIVLADSAANATEADGAGITVNGASATITYDAANDEWDFNKTVNITGNSKVSNHSIVPTIYGGITALPTLTLQNTNGNSNHSKILVGNQIASDNGGISLYTAGSSVATERVRISGTSGNVGIGTNTPAAKLHVDNGAGTRLFVGTANNIYYDAYDHIFRTPSGASTSVTFTNTGNVGIGTANPGEKLEVNGVLQIKRDGDHPALRFVEINSGTSTTRGYIASGDWAVNGGAIDDFGISGSVTGDLLLATNAGSERLRIQNSTGNVGIGDASPSYKLTIGGGHIVLKQDTAATDGTGDIQRQAIGWHTAGAETVLGAYITSSAQGSWGGDLRFNTRGSGGGSSATRMIIQDGGNVGIGTTSPSSSAGYTTLAINGSSNSGWIQLMNGNTSVADWYSSGGVESTFRSLSGGFNFTVSGSSPIRYVINSQERMRIDSGGNVGIGTTNPGKLLTLSRATEAANEQLEFRVVGGISNGNYDGIKWSQGSSGGTTLATQRVHYYTTGEVDMGFSLRNDPNILYLERGGNVGIGTNNPLSKLDVNGNIKLYNASSDPSGTAGDMYYNTTDKTIKYHNGSNWVKVVNEVTPDQFSNLYSWWDFNGTYSNIGSGNSTITDASGNGYTLTENGTCTTEAFPSGRNGIRVGANAGNHWYTSNAVPAVGANARTLFAIFYNIKETNLDPLYHVMHYGEATTGKAFGLVQSDSTKYFQQHTWGGTGTESAAYTMDQTGNAGIMIAFSIYTGSGGKYRIYDDGTATGVNYSSSYTANTGNTYGMRIGSRINETNSNEAGDVVIGECGAYTRELSDGEMDSIANGLLARWL